MLPVLAHAEIYKVIDAQGNVTYTNVKMKGAIKTDIESPPASYGGDKPAAAPAAKKQANTKTATPSSFPKVDNDTQNQRDDKRKEVLRAELDAEKKALEDAKKAHAEGASNPEVFKNPAGQTFRNVPKFDAKMKALQAEVDAHQRNIELLNKEIGN